MPCEPIKIYVAGHRGMVGSAIIRTLNAQGQPQIITRTHSEPSSGQTALRFALMFYTHTPQGNTKWLMAKFC